MLRTLLPASLAGALCVFGFAPYGYFLLPVLSLSWLFLHWQAAPQHAGRIGFAYGFGYFASGVSWVYVALHDYGTMPALLAALATGVFAAVLALFPALAGLLGARLPQLSFRAFAAPDAVAGTPRPRPHLPPAVALCAAMPAAWVLLEWLRGLFLTGFPWLAAGYAQSDSPLAGYAPLLGVYGVSWLAALSSGGLALAWSARGSHAGRMAVLGFTAIWLGGSLLRTVPWSAPQGAPLSVALIQGNVEQGVKFTSEGLVAALADYGRLVLQQDAQLTILPETALPLYYRDLPSDWLRLLSRQAEMNRGDVLLGAFEQDGSAIYNTVFSVGSAPEQRYRKQHLVPFGEFIPLRAVLGPLINDVLQIPMGDLARGSSIQPLLQVAGQRVAMAICYEDVFGEELIRALPEATLLVNVSNDAWYGQSHAASQHNQIAQLRALETGRMMLRATNTGVTSVIGADGRILQQLPQHQTAVLGARVQGYGGITPYVRYGNAVIVLLLAGALGYAWLRRVPAD